MERSRLVRSILAVAAGFVFIAALAVGADTVLLYMMPQAFSPSGRVENTAVLLLIITYVFVFAVAGCYLTARLAPQNPLKHALILGALGLILNIIGSWARWDRAPAWYHIVALALVLPAAWLGGRLGERKDTRSRPEPN